MNAAEAQMTVEFFPTDRETFRAHHPVGNGKQMTRQEHIDHAVIGLSSEVMMPINRRQYEVFYDERIGKSVELGELQFAPKVTVFPTWEEAVAIQKPWLANDEVFAKYQAMEPFDRFRMLTCGLPWTDEVIDALKNDDGVKR